MKAAAVALLMVAALGLAGVVQSSIFIGTNLTGASLRIDASGTAEVSWMQRGSRQVVLVPAHGQLTHGGGLSGPDVSRPAAAAGLPLALVVRRTPDGRFWALQEWPYNLSPGVDLHLARWSGAPTRLTLSFDGSRLTGLVTFHGKPVTGTSSTLEGKHPRVYVYLDCSQCPAAPPGWERMAGVAPKADGSFALLLRPSWIGKRYRASVFGQNVGDTFEPDAQVVIPG